MAGETTPRGEDQSRRYLSPQEFSRLSGLSLATVHRYLKAGKLPYRQPGGHRTRILIPVDALEPRAGDTPAQVAAQPSAAPPPSPETPVVSTSTRLPGPKPQWAHRAGAPSTKET
jgi:hypothetical protein